MLRQIGLVQPWPTIPTRHINHSTLRLFGRPMTFPPRHCLPHRCPPYQQFQPNFSTIRSVRSNTSRPNLARHPPNWILPAAINLIAASVTILNNSNIAYTMALDPPSGVSNGRTKKTKTAASQHQKRRKNAQSSEGASSVAGDPPHSNRRSPRNHDNASTPNSTQFATASSPRRSSGKRTNKEVTSPQLIERHVVASPPLKYWIPLAPRQIKRRRTEGRKRIDMMI